LIVIDAFNSSAIPLHLVTREAFALYRQKLTPDGIIAVNAASFLWDIQRIICHGGKNIERVCTGRNQPNETPDWIVLRRPDRLPASSTQWHALNYQPLPHDWTDDFTSPAGAIRWPRLTFVRKLAVHLPFMRGPR
jgi:hypothetical protein